MGMFWQEERCQYVGKKACFGVFSTFDNVGDGKWLFYNDFTLAEKCQNMPIWGQKSLFLGFYNFWPYRLWKVAILRWFCSWTFFDWTHRLKVNIKKVPSRPHSINFCSWITYKMSKRLKFKIWGPLDYPEKSYKDLFFHFQRPLVASNDPRGLSALESKICMSRAFQNGMTLGYWSKNELFRAPRRFESNLIKFSGKVWASWTASFRGQEIFPMMSGDAPRHT